MRAIAIIIAILAFTAIAAITATAAMIAITGYYKYLQNDFVGLGTSANARSL